MKISLDLSKSIYENASVYYEEAKKLEGKKLRLLALRKVVPVKQKQPELKERRGWFTQFHYFFTSNNFLVVSGKDAKQNDLLYSKHLTPEDLFFHAEIVGASATILKAMGKKPSEQDELEASQFAACYSRAWKQSYYSCDVYRVTGENISKYSQGEVVGKGAFMILGERKWFKNTELKLKIGVEKNFLAVLPFNSSKKLEHHVALVPGQVPKETLAKEMARKYKAREEELLKVIPGDSNIVE